MTTDTSKRPETETQESDTPSPSPLPKDGLILLPVRNTVLFPGMVLPLRGETVLLKQDVQAAVRRQSPLDIVLQRDPQVMEPLSMNCTQ